MLQAVCPVWTEPSAWWGWTVRHFPIVGIGSLVYMMRGFASRVIQAFSWP